MGSEVIALLHIRHVRIITSLRNSELNAVSVDEFVRQTSGYCALIIFGVLTIKMVFAKNNTAFTLVSFGTKHANVKFPCGSPSALLTSSCAQVMKIIYTNYSRIHQHLVSNPPLLANPNLSFNPSLFANPTQFALMRDKKKRYPKSDDLARNSTMKLL